MNSAACSRTAIASLILNLAPPLIRETLLNDPNFREEYGVETDVTITFGSSGISLQRSELFDAARAVLAGEARVSLIDTEGGTWSLGNTAGSGDIPDLVLSSNSQRLPVPDLSALSVDVSTRVHSLENSASDVNLPPSAQEEWRSILEARPLRDDEVDALHDDIRDTPVYVERNIRSEIMAGRGSMTTLVPKSSRYFGRLVGVYDGSRSITAYAAGQGRAFIEQLLQWKPREGFLFSLLLSSHSVLTAEINTDRLDNAELVEALDIVERHEGMLSRIGAFEVGLRCLSERPEVEPFLLRLVDQVRKDDVDGEMSEFQLFAALFVLVDGELARTRLLAEGPPFYRRLASLAQAGLIHRQLAQCGVDYGRFSDWALSRSGEHYYMQSLADMRTEPRWNPDLAAASQMQADFLGRIMIAGHRFGTNLGDGELRDTVLGDGERSIAQACEFRVHIFRVLLKVLKTVQLPCLMSLRASLKRH